MTNWPVAADVSGFLSDAGFGSLPSVDFGELVVRAIDDVHSTVGFSPFLAGAEESFESLAIEGVVVIDRPFAEVSEVLVGGESVEFLTCPQLVTPVRKLVLENGFSGVVSVVGRAGFGLTVPIDVWYAVRDLAASYVVELVDVAAADSVESVKQDSVTIKYRPGGLQVKFAEILADRARLIFARYRFIGMGA
ncbi:MAG: hypothetical protein ACKVQS_04570 [Fimbriimonadaceae bacterium]